MSDCALSEIQWKEKNDWSMTVMGSNPRSFTYHLCDLVQVIKFSKHQFSNLNSENNYAFQVIVRENIQ